MYINIVMSLGYVNSAYGSVSHLQFGDFIIESAEGIQQGNPLGPLLFCLAIPPLFLNIQSEFVSGYLDDIGIGGERGGCDDLRHQASRE